MTYDMFNQPLTNSLAGTKDPNNGNDACPIGTNELSATTGAKPTTLSTDPTATGITGMIVTCPKYESDGKSLSPLAGQAVIANLMPGRWGVIATPGADRIARGEEWLQTNTLDGQKAHDVFTRIGEPSFFQEFGPASYHVSIGFANPAIINAPHNVRLQRHGPLPPPPTGGYACNNTITGKVTSERLSRTPDERLYSSGSHDAYYWSQCYVSFGDPDGEDFAFTKCNADGTFTLTGLPAGNWRVTVFDQWNDLLVDGLSTPVCDNRPGSGTTSNMGDIAVDPVGSESLHPHLHRRQQGRHLAGYARTGFPLPTSRCACATAASRTCWSRISPAAPISMRRSRSSVGTRWKPT